MTTVASIAGVFRHGDESEGGRDERLALLGLRQPTPLPEADLATGMIARLRAVVPKRPLGVREAEKVAERQADRLRSELKILRPCLDEADLASLAWLSITRRENLPTAGVATKTDYGWIVVLRADDPMVRQRFTLAHEIKHILDDSLIDLHGGLYPSLGGYSQHERTEYVCHRFAGALLMPKALLRADWFDGLQDIAKLARRYHVSRQAMSVRLSQLGLLEAVPRCLPPDQHTAVEAGR
jgi:Zn-dependent peptidase ImmA (M78 family)